MKLGVRKLTDLEALVLLTSKIEFVLFFKNIFHLSLYIDDSPTSASPTVKNVLC